MASVRSLKLTTDWMGCIEPISSYPRTFHESKFIIGPLDMAMALFWRVRKFKVNVSSYISGPEQPQVTDEFIMSYGSAQNGTTNINSETDLICVLHDPWTRNNFGNCELDIQQFWIYKDESNYLVDFSVGDGETFYSVYDEEYTYGEIGTWTMEFSGYKISKPLYRTRSFETSGPASVVMEAVEYWGYDPNDGGGPIYNTYTGERIRYDV